MPNDAKREAQEALFNAVRDQAQTSVHAALPAAEKIRLLRELAEAYRLTAGGSVPVSSSRSEKSSDDGARKRTSAR